MHDPYTKEQGPIGTAFKAARDLIPKDVIKCNLPPKENHELAEELLSRFPGIDRAKLLKDMVSLFFFWMRHGNKFEERAACEFLNEVQRIAIRNSKSK